MYRYGVTEWYPSGMGLTGIFRSPFGVLDSPINDLGSKRSPPRGSQVPMIAERVDQRRTAITVILIRGRIDRLRSRIQRLAIESVCIFHVEMQGSPHWLVFPVSFSEFEDGVTDTHLGVPDHTLRRLCTQQLFAAESTLNECQQPLSPLAMEIRGNRALPLGGKAGRLM